MSKDTMNKVDNHFFCLVLKASNRITEIEKTITNIRRGKICSRSAGNCLTPEISIYHNGIEADRNAALAIDKKNFLIGN